MGPVSGPGDGARRRVHARKVRSAPHLPTLRRVHPLSLLPAALQHAASDDSVGDDVQGVVVPVLSVLAAIVVAYVAGDARRGARRPARAQVRRSPPT